VRRALRLLGNRVVIAGGLALLIGIAIVLADAVRRERDTGARPYAGGNTTLSTVDPTAGDDSEPSPTPSAYADDKAVLAVGASFLTAWLRSDLSPSAWHDGVSKHATAKLAQSLQGVDPSGVPATRTTGAMVIVLRSDAYAQLAVPVDSGTVRLTLVLTDGAWLVDGVDWDRAP
jgi:hypothetical protein